MDRNQEINIEQDFWDDFIVEAFEHIDAIEQNAMSLEQNPEDMDIIHTMFRAFHTIKGLSGFVEHVIIQEIAHKTETMMDYCRKGVTAVNTEIVNAILKSSDCIKILCNDMNAYKDQALLDTIEELLNNLERMANQAEASKNGAPQEALPEPEAQAQPVEQIEALPEIDEQQAELEKIAGLESFVEEINEIQHEVEEHEKEHEKELEELNNAVTQESESLTDVVPAVEEMEIENTEMVPVSEELLEVQQVPVEEDVIESQVVETVENNEDYSTPNAVPEVTKEVQVEENITNNENVVVPQNESNKLSDQEQKINELMKTIEALKAQNQDKKDEPVFDVNETIEYNRTESPQNSEAPKKMTEFQKQVLQKLQENQPQKAVNKNEPAQRSSGSNEEYMKVANYKIDHLVDIIGELIINQALIDQYVSANYSNDRQLTTNMSGFLRVTRDLQNLSMSLRMVSLKPTFQKLNRIARDTIQELKKDVEFVMSGESTEIDRAVAERLLEPLVHMIKNAISHGVEPNSDDRVALGKPRKARVELNAYSKRGKIFIEVKDDGRGINTEIVYKKALEKGIIDPEKTYSESEIKEFIMLPGFSTAAVVDNISGRGVGMDVVNTQIQKAGGRVEILSTLNEGSTFILEVPVNHSIMNGTIIDMNNQQFVVPTINVKEFLKPSEEQWIFTKQERTMIRVRDNIIPMVPLSTFFKGIEEPEEIPLVMVLELEQELRAIPIVEVISRQEVVVKPVGEEFQHLKYISGMSILGTGNVSLILDIDYLFKKEIQ